MILVSDIHLDLKPENSYRWGIFPLLDELIDDDNKESDNKGLYILGDLTVSKDGHSNKLLNKIAKEIIKLSEKTKVTIISGNHDYSVPEEPVLAFLDEFDSIDYYTQPTFIDDCAYLPHTFEPEKEWNDLDFTDVSIIFMHQTVQGSEGDNGKKLKGIDLSFFKERGFNGVIYSGDVHTPQEVDDMLVYLGSPYHINFGSSFEPRLLFAESFDHLRQRDYIEVEGDFPKKLTLSFKSIDEVNQFDFDDCKGDFCKVKLTIDANDKIHWREYKDQIKGLIEQAGGVLSDFDVIVSETINKEQEIEDSTTFISVNDVFDRYVEQEGIDDYILEVGKEFVE